MLSRTSLFDPGHLLMAMPKWPCPARHGHYPLYPKGYKGVKWPCLSSAPPAPSRGHVWPCRNARSFLLLASAHCPQAPPLPFALLATCRDAWYAGRRRRAEPLRTQQSGCSKLKEVY